MLEHCPAGCERSCYACMRHFRNQQDHAVVDRHRAAELLQRIGQPLEAAHRIPSTAGSRAPDPGGSGGGTGEGPGGRDSDAEDRFVELCRDRNTPVPPRSQYRVDLGDGTTSLADFAHPDESVLVYVDGMSEHLHGDPARRRRDRLTRAKLRMEGWNVVEATAEQLRDEAGVSALLEELAVYLSGPA